MDGRTSLLLLCAVLTPGICWASSPDPLDSLYRRMAADILRGKPVVATVHVALCDNEIIWCGSRGMGRGNAPRTNLYWGAAAGFRATFDRARGYRRVHLDDGDGEQILQRVVYRYRVRHPSGRWRALGIREGFDLFLVGLAYRGSKIGRATSAFIDQVLTQSGETLELDNGRTLPTGGRGHLVGYAGHNHLMDLSGYRWPRHRRQQPLGYFALACKSGTYMAGNLCSDRGRALLLTLSLIYPGAFTIDGLIRGVAAGLPQHQVYLQGVKQYARFQKRPEGIIRRAFIHDGQQRFYRIFTRCPGPG